MQGPMKEDLHPHSVYYANRDKFAALRTRIHDACVEFQKKSDRIFQMTRPVTESKAGFTMTYSVADKISQEGAFCQLCRWFIGELCDAWTEHIVERVGLRRQAAVKAFLAECDKFVPIAMKHNWAWGYRRLQLGDPDDEAWRSLIDLVITMKANELRGIWGMSVPRVPARAQSPRVTLDPKPELLKNPNARLNRQRAAEALGITVRTLSRWVSDGIVAPVGVGRQKRFKASDLAALVNQKRRDTEGHSGT